MSLFHPEQRTVREIVTPRVVAAPRALVINDWTDSDMITREWGPNDFTTCIDEMDVRPGGHWRFVLHGPDGRDHQPHSDYVEITSPASSSSITSQGQNSV